MTTLLLILTAVAAGLLSVAGWWIYRTNLAVQPKGRRPLRMRPLPTGCDIGERLMMAAATGTTGGTSRPAGGGSSRRTRKGPSRRAFLRGSMFGAMGVFLGGFGGATLAFLWPNLAGGFGAVIDIGDEESIRQFIRENRQPWEAPEGRLYLVEYDAAEDREDEYHEVTDGGQAPLMALFQTCVHLGCRVPWCATSQWFECPCHGSRYNRWGEYRAGPAGRGLDRFALTIEDGRVIVDTSEVITGPSRAMNSLEQPPAGPSCV